MESVGINAAKRHIVIAAGSSFVSESINIPRFSDAVTMRADTRALAPRGQGNFRRGLLDRNFNPGAFALAFNAISADLRLVPGLSNVHFKGVFFLTQKLERTASGFRSVGACACLGVAPGRRSFLAVP